jgi:hypothetical protein
MSTRCQPTSGPSAISSPRPSNIDDVSTVSRAPRSFLPSPGGPWRGRVARLDEAALRPSERGGVTVYLWRRCLIGPTSASPEPSARQQGAHKGRPYACRFRRGDPCGRPPSAPRVQPVSCKGVGQMPVRNQCETWDKALPAVIARSSCDEAIQLSFYGGDGLLRSIERALARPIGSQRRAKICTLPAIMREALIAHHKP